MSSPTPVLVHSMDRNHLVTLCKTYGATLDPMLAATDDGFGKPLAGAQLLWALCGRESIFGKDLGPRHEPAYDVGGSFYRESAELQQGVALYGRDFACSYGPLQVMACNAKGHTPRELGADPDTAMGAAVGFLRIRALQHFGAKTLEQICQVWNGGHLGATTTAGYFEEVRHHYITEVLG